MMLTPDEIAELIDHAERRGMRALAIEAPGFALRLEFPASVQGAPVLPQDAPPAEPVIPVKATGFGRLLTAPPLGGAAFAAPDRRVEKGEIVALLQVGPLYRPVRAPIAGIVATMPAEPGALVGYGDEILGLKPSGEQAR